MTSSGESPLPDDPHHPVRLIVRGVLAGAGLRDREGERLVGIELWDLADRVIEVTTGPQPKREAAGGGGSAGRPWTGESPSGIVVTAINERLTPLMNGMTWHAADVAELAQTIWDDDIEPNLHGVRNGEPEIPAGGVATALSVLDGGPAIYATVTGYSNDGYRTIDSNVAEVLIRLDYAIRTPSGTVTITDRGYRVLALSRDGTNRHAGWTRTAITAGDGCPKCANTALAYDHRYECPDCGTEWEGLPLDTTPAWAEIGIINEHRLEDIPLRDYPPRPPITRDDALKLIAARSCEKLTTGPGSCCRPVNRNLVLPTDDSGGTAYEMCIPCVAWWTLNHPNAHQDPELAIGALAEAISNYLETPAGSPRNQLRAALRDVTGEFVTPSARDEPEPRGYLPLDRYNDLVSCAGCGAIILDTATQRDIHDYSHDQNRSASS